MLVATELELYICYTAEDDAMIRTNGKRNVNVFGCTRLKYG